MKKLLIASAITLVAQSVLAVPSIQYVDYNRDKIPAITTAAGIATEIIFEDDETIEYTTFGFDSAWESQIVRDHILVFKAKDEQPETNLIVHTNKRDYLFTVVSGNNEWKKDPNNSHAIYSMRMVYHDRQSKAALAAKAAYANAQAKVKAEKAKQEYEQSVLRNRDISPRSTYIHINYDYRATDHAQDITPRRMWDNGTLTFIAFRSGTKRGVVYELDHNNKASLVNQHTEKNGLLVLHGVYQHLIIRLGDESVEIRRNTQGGQIENNTKTTVANTVRTVSNTAPTAYGSDSPANSNISIRRLSQPKPKKVKRTEASPAQPEIITITAEPNAKPAEHNAK